MSRLGNLHTLPSETKELQNFPSQSACDSSTESEKRGACVFSCKPQGPLPHETAWVAWDSYGLLKVKHYMSADLENLHQANGRDILSSERVEERVKFFSYKNVFEKSDLSKNVFKTYLGVFVQWACSESTKLTRPRPLCTGGQPLQRTEACSPKYGRTEKCFPINSKKKSCSDGVV